MNLSHAYGVPPPAEAAGKLLLRALDLGIETKGSTPDEMDARMRSDIDKWTKVIESAHIPKQ